MEESSAVIASQPSNDQVYIRKIPVPPHRYKPLKKEWRNIYNLLHNTMNIDIRMNLKTSTVELRTRPDDLSSTPDTRHLQKCVDFVHAFILGFNIDDAKTLLQDENDDVYVFTFEFKDPNELRSCETIERDIVERSTETRIVIADTKVHILGSFNGINAAKKALLRLVLHNPNLIVAASNPSPIISKL